MELEFNILILFYLLFNCIKFKIISRFKIRDAIKLLFVFINGFI